MDEVQLYGLRGLDVGMLTSALDAEVQTCARCLGATWYRGQLDLLSQDNVGAKPTPTAGACWYHRALREILAALPDLIDAARTVALHATDPWQDLAGDLLAALAQPYEYEGYEMPADVKRLIARFDALDTTPSASRSAKRRDDDI